MMKGALECRTENRLTRSLINRPSWLLLVPCFLIRATKPMRGRAVRYACRLSMLVQLQPPQSRTLDCPGNTDGFPAFASRRRKPEICLCS